jgi:hypothetical protein
MGSIAIPVGAGRRRPDGRWFISSQIDLRVLAAIR